MSHPKNNNVQRLSEAAHQVAMCEAIAQMVKDGRMTIPEQGVPMMIGGLRVLIVKDQAPLQ